MQIDRCFGFDTAVEEAQRALLAAKVRHCGRQAASPPAPVLSTCFPSRRLHNQTSGTDAMPWCSQHKDLFSCCAAHASIARCKPSGTTLRCCTWGSRSSRLACAGGGGVSAEWGGPRAPHGPLLGLYHHGGQHGLRCVAGSFYDTNYTNFVLNPLQHSLCAPMWLVRQTPIRRRHMRPCSPVPCHLLDASLC